MPIHRKTKKWNCIPKLYYFYLFFFLVHFCDGRIMSFTESSKAPILCKLTWTAPPWLPPDFIDCDDESHSREPHDREPRDREPHDQQRSDGASASTSATNSDNDIVKIENPNFIEQVAPLPGSIPRTPEILAKVEEFEKIAVEEFNMPAHIFREKCLHPNVFRPQITADDFRDYLEARWAIGFKNVEDYKEEVWGMFNLVNTEMPYNENVDEDEKRGVYMINRFYRLYNYDIELFRSIFLQDITREHLTAILSDIEQPYGDYTRFFSPSMVAKIENRHVIK